MNSIRLGGLFLGFMLCLMPALAQTTYMGTVEIGDEDYGFWNNVALLSDGTRGFAADPENSRLIIFDPRRYNNNIVATVGPLGLEPASVFLTPAEDFICVININSDTISVIRLSDLQTATYTPPSLTDFAVWSNIAFTPSGAYGFVCDTYRNNNDTHDRVHVFRVSADSNNLHHNSLPTGFQPARTYISPSGDKAFVLCMGKIQDDEITVLRLDNEPGFGTQQTFQVKWADFDRFDDRINRTIYNNIVFAPGGGRGYVCDPRWNDVVAFDIPNYNNQPFLDIPSPWETDGELDFSLSQIAISPDGNYLMASSVFRNRVYIIDRSTLGLLNVIDDPLVDFDAYNNIVSSGWNTRAFIGSFATDEIVEFDYTNGAIIRYLSTWGGPEALAASADGRFLTAVNIFSETVDLFSLAPRIINVPFFKSGVDQYTGYGVSNATSEPVSMTIAGIDPAGIFLPGTDNPSIQILENRSQLPFIGDQLLGLPEGEHTGWLQIISNSLDTRSYFINTDLDGNYMDGTIATDELFTEFYITHVQENLFEGLSTVQTEIFLVNPYNLPVDLRLSLRDGQGTEISFMEQSLANGEMLSGTLRQLFLRQEPAFNITQGYIYGEMTNFGLGVAGFARVNHFQLLKSDSIRTMHSLPLQAPLPTQELFCAHVAHGGEQEAYAVPYTTTLDIINTSTENAQLRFEFSNDSSSKPLPQVEERTLGPQQQLSISAWELFGWPNPSEQPPYFTGALTISSDQPGIIGDVVFGDGMNSPPWFQSCLALDQYPYTRAVFSHVAHGPAGGDLVYINGISIWNPNSFPIYVTVGIYRQDGTLTGGNGISLDPGERLLRLLDAPELVPAVWGQLGGYVEVNSVSEFVAFELFIDNQNRFISAVPRN